MSFMKKLWKKSVERRKVQQQQKLHQLEDAPSPQQSPKTTEMRESKGRRVSPHPSPSTSNAFGTTVAKPGARSEVWTESQVLDFLDADVPCDDAAAEPAWDPSADALVEMKDEEDDEEEAQLASVHTSCRQGDDNRNNNNATVHLSSLSDNSGVSNDCSVTSVVPNKAPEGQQSLVLSGSPQNYGNDPNVTLISNDNVNSDTNDNAMSLYPSDLSLNQGECHLQGSELNASETTDSETSTELSSDSDASEDGLQMSNPRPQLKLNTAIQPLSPPLGKSPGITQSKGKLKLKAKKNSKSKK